MQRAYKPFFRAHPPNAQDMSINDQTVAIVILNWNGGEEIQNCLNSVYESTHPAIKVVIVDNGSKDGSTDLIRSRFPSTHLISNPHNFGFAKGSNQGMEWALEQGIEYILLLNGDARLHSQAIEELLAIARSENDAVVACPRIYLGGLDAGVNRLWFAFGTVSLWLGLFRNPAFNQPDLSQWSIPIDMEYASGCCILVSARILQKVGMLDEAFFAYCEDIDFSLRIRKAGFRLRYVPTARIWHGSSVPTKRTRSGMYRYLSTRNNLWVVRKHGSWFEVCTCVCILPLRCLLRIVRSVMSADWHVIAAELRGIKDGIFMQFNSHA